jgi:hypothetical protein
MNASDPSGSLQSRLHRNSTGLRSRARSTNQTELIPTTEPIGADGQTEVKQIRHCIFVPAQNTAPERWPSAQQEQHRTAPARELTVGKHPRRRAVSGPQARCWVNNPASSARD